MIGIVLVSNLNREDLTFEVLRSAVSGLCFEAYTPAEALEIEIRVMPMELKWKQF